MALLLRAPRAARLRPAALRRLLWVGAGSSAFFPFFFSFFYIFCFLGKNEVLRLARPEEGMLCMPAVSSRWKVLDIPC